MTADNLMHLLRKIGPRRLLMRAVESVEPAIGRRLALQGGGALGSFTWGVLDALLEHDDQPIARVSGASAGALNAAVMATGLVQGGRERAREALAALWKDVASSGAMAEAASLPGMIGERLTGFRRTSPPLARSGKILLGLIEKHVDVDAVRSGTAPRLFISATHVQTNAARIFTNHEIDHDVILASACLPMVQPPVFIDGEAYWDGGFSSNPPLQPLVGGDILLIRLLRFVSRDIPKTADEVDRHLKEYLFARPLQAEVASLAGSAIEEVALEDHVPDAKLDSIPTPRLVGRLFEAGQAAGRRFLESADQETEASGLASSI